MRHALIALLTLTAAMATAPAQAVPTAFYNPATGEVEFGRFENFGGNPLALATLFSEQGNLRPGPDLGGGVDNGDLPNSITFFAPGPTIGTELISVGPIVVPGTQVSDLRMQYFTDFSPSGGPHLGMILVVPEPGLLASVLLAAATLCGRAGGYWRTHHAHGAI